MCRLWVLTLKMWVSTVGKKWEARLANAASNFEAKSKSFHGDTYDYSKAINLGTKINVELVCSTHGSFWQTPSNHYKFGCSQCGIEAATKFHTGSLEHFKARVLSKFGEVFDYTRSTYITANQPITLECLTCGDTIDSTLDNVLGRDNSCNCKTLYNGRVKKYLPAIMYYLKVTYAGHPAYKIGITNSSVAERFKGNNKGEIEVIKEWSFAVGQDAIDSETRIKQQFRVYKWDGQALLRDGNSELFDRDILELDEEML